MKRSPAPAAASSPRSRRLRAASEDELVAQALPRLDALIAEGVTTIEIKSGYGLDLETEAKSLRAARAAGASSARSRSRTTFLGAHALPPEAEGDKDAYIDLVADEMLPAIAAEGLADAVDGFCEGIAFSPEQIARVFDAAKALGLPVKLHADQLSNLHGAALAAELRRAVGRPSRIYRRGRRRGDGAGRHRRGAAARRLLFHPRDARSRRSSLFRQHGVPMALATDCNPGTSPLTSLLLTMNMAATLFG